MKFRYNQKVTITKGFYKSFSGFIKDVDEKTLFYTLDVDLKDKNKEIKIHENDIKSSWF